MHNGFGLKRNFTKKHMFEKFKTAGYHDITYPHREILHGIIAKHNPTSIIDLGCASGPDLFLVHESFPEAKLFGVDRNGDGLNAVRGMGGEVIVGPLELVIQNIPDKSFDVVMTNGVLMYLKDEQINDVLDHMIRITKKAIILSEINPYSPNNLRDYVGYFTDKGLRCEAHKIPPEIRSDTEWSHNGYIYEAVIG